MSLSTFYTKLTHPPSILPHFPYPVSYFLGHRRPLEPHHRHPLAFPTQSTSLLTALTALHVLIVTFAAIAILSLIFQSPSIRSIFTEHAATPAILIASYGASSILQFNAVASPFAQPRNEIGGQVGASIISVGVTKLFLYIGNGYTSTVSSSGVHTLTPSASFEKYRYLNGALNVALSSTYMYLTGTIYPPAGATAFIASTQLEFIDVGWWYVAMVTAATAFFVGLGLITSNFGLRWPVYWFWAGSPAPQKQTEKSGKEVEEKKKDGHSGHQESRESDAQGERKGFPSMHEEADVKITMSGIHVAEGLWLSNEERNILETLRARLYIQHDLDGEDSSVDGSKLSRKSTGNDSGRRSLSGSDTSTMV